MNIVKIKKFEYLMSDLTETFLKPRYQINIFFELFNSAHIIYSIFFINLVFIGNIELNPGPNKKNSCHSFFSATRILAVL